LEGCELAAELEGMPDGQDIFALSMNTNAEEFAPVPFSEDILYYSTNENGNTQLKRIQFAGGDWSDPVDPKLPKGPAGNTCHGAFSPDHSSFYFTVCLDDMTWNSRDVSCEIFGTMRTADGWSTPERMRDYLKMDGNTATQPTIVHRDGKEWMYFVSDRTGGEGGLDIWYTSREIDSGSFDFTFPENAGSMVNTPGDEFSPFYDGENEKLYFSSNGHPNIGGFDIYASKGYGMKWMEPIHQGMPINSPADDYYYQKAPGGGIAFFTSNRSTMDWESTTDDNIFQVGMVSNPLAQLQGKVLNRESLEPIDGASVMIKQVNADGDEVLMTTQYTKEGAYEIPLVTGKNYKLEALAQGFAANAVNIDPADLSSEKVLMKDIYLHAQDGAVMASNTSNAIDNATKGLQESTEEIIDGSMETPPVMAVTSGSMGIPNTNSSTTISSSTVPATTSIPSTESIDLSEVKEVFESNNPVATTEITETLTYDRDSDYMEEYLSSDEDFSSTESTTTTNTTSSYTDTWTDNSFTNNSTSSGSKEIGTFNATTSSSYETTPTYTAPAYQEEVVHSNSGGSYIPSEYDPVNSGSATYTTGRFKNDGVTTSAPKHMGSYYKIQVSIELNYDQFAPQLQQINGLGRVDTEYIIEKGWIRVLLADYFSKDEALRVLYEVRDLGFPEAFLVRYQDGYRKI